LIEFRAWIGWRWHVINRSAGGPTLDWNLRAQCGFHHQVVHLPGWREQLDPDGTVHVYRPDGTEVTASPPPLAPDLRERMKDWLPFRGTDPPPDTS
jgi:hypothetical protein